MSNTLQAKITKNQLYLSLTFHGLHLIRMSGSDWFPQGCICLILMSFFQISACTCPYTTESLWWRRLPPPAQKAVGSRLFPPPLHPLPPLLPHAQRTSFTAGQKSSIFHSRTPSPRGRVPRCFLTYWRRGCFCGWCPTGYTLSASARDECTGKALWLHIWINPTSWRRSSRANCLTPSNSLLVSTCLCTAKELYLYNPKSQILLEGASYYDTFYP